MRTRSPGSSARRRTALRLCCVTLAVGLGALIPAGPAVAQIESPDYDFEPPPVNLSVPLPNDSSPQPGVTQKKACIGSLGGGNIVPQSKPWGQLLLGIDQLHNLGYRGENMTVAVIDTGVNRHPWLKKLRGAADLVNPADGGLKDCDGHGTEVAGIIAADTPSDIGFKGVAPAAEIMSIRQSSENWVVPDPQGGRDIPAGDVGTLAKAIRVAADRPEVSVINVSIDNCRGSAQGMRADEVRLQRVLHYAVIERDKVVVASAGNQSGQGPDCVDPKNGSDPARPTSIVLPPWFTDYVLSVAAVQRNGDLASFSVQGPWVSLAAPGTDILSLDPASSGLANQTSYEGQVQPIQGTSFAAPYVAGVATLVRQKFPNLTAKQVMERLKYTAQHPATPTGRDNLVGYGMVNPIAALTAMVPSEFGIPRDKAVALPPDAPPVELRDRTPMLVALIGSGSGLALLGITLFTMHTIRRNRPKRVA